VAPAGLESGEPDPAGLDPAAVGERIEQLLGSLTGHTDPEVGERAEELAGLLMDMYGAAMARIVELLPEAAGAGTLRAVASDELVGGLLVLHDLHPDDTATRAATALDSVRPYLGSHAGDVELLGVSPGTDPGSGADGPVVRLALRGNCDGCPSSTVTVRTAIESAIAQWCPEVVAVQVDGMTEPARAGTRARGELPLLQIQPRPPSDLSAPSTPVGWVTLDPPPLRPGQCAVLDVAGHPVLLARPADRSASEEPLAYIDACAACGSSLRGARLDGVRLSCPGCAAGFDLRRAGRTLDDGPPLEPLPLVRRAGGWRLALPRTRAGAPS
jgi:Fe-S cluster biogenesis protein NfuA